MDILKIKIIGDTPLLMHSPKSINPLDEAVIAHKEMTADRQKTAEDHRAINRSDWMLSLYYHPDIGVYVPGDNLHASLIQGGKLSKLGAAIQRAVYVVEDECPLKYEGPKNPEDLYNDRRFVDLRSVVISKRRVMRCRPVFKKWSFEATIAFDSGEIDPNRLLNSLSDAGRLIGMGDYRPSTGGGKFGRFSVGVLN